jgi:hypothetical protein
VVVSYNVLADKYIRCGCLIQPGSGPLF